MGQETESRVPREKDVHAGLATAIKGWLEPGIQLTDAKALDAADAALAWLHANPEVARELLLDSLPAETEGDRLRAERDATKETYERWMREAEAEADRLRKALRRLDHLLAAPGGLSPADVQREGRAIIQAALSRFGPDGKEKSADAHGDGTSPT